MYLTTVPDGVIEIAERVNAEFIKQSSNIKSAMLNKDFHGSEIIIHSLLLKNGVVKLT